MKWCYKKCRIEGMKELCLLISHIYKQFPSSHLSCSCFLPALLIAFSLTLYNLRVLVKVQEYLLCCKEIIEPQSYFMLYEQSLCWKFVPFKTNGCNSYTLKNMFNCCWFAEDWVIPSICMEYLCSRAVFSEDYEFERGSFWNL